MTIPVKYILSILFFSLFLSAKSQIDENLFPTQEQELKSLFDSLFTRDSTRYLKSDFDKNRLNDSIKKIFFQSLNSPNSLTYPYDSLKHIGKLYSSDKQVRIITWNLKYSNGTFKYFGFVQYKNQKKDNVITYTLTDKSDSITNPENIVLSNSNWFGALYYQMYDYKEGGKNYYILFGWDGNSYYTNKKIIEILSFSNTGKPIFGKSVFKTEEKTKKRILFEHSIKASMSCKYNTAAEAIIFDHLSPPKPSQIGQFQFYGPDGSYDGFIFKKGKWIFVSNIYVTNPREKKKK